MAKISDWVGAFRLKTLPLALSCILMGSTLAFNSGGFKGDVFGLAILTTLLLQILSNLANDYGDSVKGTDNENRLGPERSVQSGAISLKSMKNAVILFAVLALIAGLTLLFVAFPTFDGIQWVFLLLGIASIAAAINYTIGKNPYGYSGLGDVFVFVFFGLVGVIGTYYLQTQSFGSLLFLPAITVGCFSMGVLNLNNLRDIENDADNNKITLAVRLGKKGAVAYHIVLLMLGWIAHVIYCQYSAISYWQWLFVLSAPIFFLNGSKVISHKNPKELIPSLKQLALGTFFFCVLFALGSAIGHV